MRFVTRKRYEYVANFIRLIIGAYITIVLITGVVLAEPVKVSASSQGNFGRIVFNWKNPVTHALSGSNGRLTLRFGRSIDAIYDSIPRNLKKFVRSASLGLDGQSVLLVLTNDFDVYSFDSGSAVIVEIVEKKIVDKRAVSPLSPKAKNSVNKKKSVPKVGVRAGQHRNYTRLVFDWPSKVSYRFKRNGEKTTLTFSSAAQFNFKALNLRPPSFIRDARAEVKKQSSKVILSIPPTSKIRHFLSGSKVVLDVQKPIKSDSIANAPKKKKVKKTSLEANSSSAISRPTRLMPVSGQAIKAEKKANSPVAGGESLQFKKEKKGTLKTASQLTVQDGLPPLSASKVVATATAKSSAPPADAVTLRFDWDEPVGAAIFRRAGNLWVAFDKLKEIDIKPLRTVGKKFIKGIEQMGTSKATVLRFSIKKGINPSVRRDGLAWLLDFSRQQVVPKTPLIVKAQPNSPVGSRLFIPVIEPRNPIGITDPVIGDNLVILPVVPLGHGIGLEYIYPQVGFLPTIQGIVIKPRVDDIRARPMREGVEVTSAGGLKISAVSPEDEENRSKGPLTKILDLEPWVVENIDSFRPKKYELLYAVSRSKGPQREEARLNLARFFFSNGFNTEALAILEEVGRKRPKIEQDPEYRMLRGGAKFMLGRYFEADKDFSHDKLKSIDEASFWRASIRAAVGNVSESALVIKRTEELVRSYPKAIKIPMGQLVVESALAIDNVKRAKKTLDNLRMSELSSKEMKQLDFQEGLIIEKNAKTATDPILADEQFDAAADKWDSVRKSEYRPSRQQATIARMELQLKRDKISRAEAIDDLENIRFTWRGDNFEFKLLRRLGDLYLEEGSYRNALDRLRQAATYFSDNKEAPQVTQKMSDIFAKLYLEDAADTLPPVTAIALYEEFKELTPAGKRGDKMIQKLADRLVGVDLLDPAIKLLKSQIQFRLKGYEKARVGAQLTLAHILARQYEKALKVLDSTEMAGIPGKLLSQRRHLRAKALMALKKREMALAVLNVDESRDAELLRAEIFWNTRDWSKASQSLHLLLRDSGAKQSKSLDGRQKAYVLNFAIALTLSGNERGLRRARKDFSSKMAESSLKDAFNLITATNARGVLDYKQVKAKVMEAENFQTFMASYRERLKNENLSDLVPRSVKPVTSNRPLLDKKQSEIAAIN